MSTQQTGFAFLPPSVATASIRGGSARFPVRRIFCVGRNYAAHVKEMGGDAARETPIFFTKPADAIVRDGGDVPYPPATRELHHEVELVIALGGEGHDLTPQDAERLIWGWAVGVDLTRRDLQNAAKKAGAPWDTAKAFDASAPLGPITRRADLLQPKGRITLTVNGDTRQDADLSDMIWSPDEIVAEASKLWTLSRGDLIFTGTPEGVGPLNRGEKVHCRIEGLEPLDFTVV
ncbi:MAG TPA: fumarylacetoacetate hydrolase family protein [Caulobacteraceae bacterium]|jgi:fumarylpyruvate hydrolase|nr:fumarylacetoacetate hydrolase family protein [Caulobacteraceae bacterium]